MANDNGVPEGFEPFATVADGASYLRVSEQTFRRFIRNKLIPSAKVGRSHRIPWSALRAFVQQQITATAS